MFRVSSKKIAMLLTILLLSTPLSQAWAGDQHLIFDANVKEEVKIDKNDNFPPVPGQKNSSYSRQNIPIANENSSIEQNFSCGFKQIGYDIFESFSRTNSGALNNNYKLNIGEKVKVYLWGDSVDMLSLTGNTVLNPIIDSQVDTSGNLFVPGVGLVKADGKTLSEVESNMQSLLRHKYSSAKVKISIANSAEIAISVYGYVNKPGKVEIGANSTIIEALAEAGGITKNGSLRNVVYKSNSKTMNIDLYDIVLQGKNINIKFQQGDSIFVRPIGNTACLTNGVKIPGIYEVKSNEKLDALISFAGGYLPDTSKSTVNIKSYSSISGQRLSKDVSEINLNKTVLANGDIIQFKNLYSQAENFITINGNVKHPGIFQYKPGMKLSSVLRNKNELLNETFIHQSVIKRISGRDKQIKSMPVSLEDLFSGGVDPKLEPGDIISVYKSTNMDMIEVFGSVNTPKLMTHSPTLSLKNIIADVKFISTTNQYNITDIKCEEADKCNEKVTNIKRIRTKNDNIMYSPSEIAVEISNPVTQENKIYYLYDVLVKNDITSSIKIKTNDKVFFRPLRENEILKTVLISGYVNNPGVYKFVKGTKLSEMIEIAGGLSDDAYLKGIVFKRPVLAHNQRSIMEYINERDKKAIEGQISQGADLSKDEIEAQKLLLRSIEDNESTKKISGRIALDIKSNDISSITPDENIEIQDGDELYIPRIPNHITVLGEVQNESSFVYSQGKKAEYYIKNVGGFTPNAKKSATYKISANGKATKIGWRANESVEPGDTIVVPRKLRNNWLEVVKSTLQIGLNALNAIFIVTKI